MGLPILAAHDPPSHFVDLAPTEPQSTYVFMEGRWLHLCMDGVIDGCFLNDGTRVLLHNQYHSPENGIYECLSFDTFVRAHGNLSATVHCKQVRHFHYISFRIDIPRSNWQHMFVLQNVGAHFGVGDVVHVQQGAGLRHARFTATPLPDGTLSFRFAV